MADRRGAYSKGALIRREGSYFEDLRYIEVILRDLEKCTITVNTVNNEERNVNDNVNVAQFTKGYMQTRSQAFSLV